jgi:hypothetical protein
LLFPVQGSWTEEDYLQLDAARLIEFSEGSIEVLPRATSLLLRGFDVSVRDVFAAGR